MLTSGPTRLLAYHACELYLKAYLREHGQEVKRLTRYRHDLDAMLAAAVAKGLCPGPRIEAQLRRATTRKDYVLRHDHKALLAIRREDAKLYDLMVAEGLIARGGKVRSD